MIETSNPYQTPVAELTERAGMGPASRVGRTLLLVSYSLVTMLISITFAAVSLIDPAGHLMTNNLISFASDLLKYIVFFAPLIAFAPKSGELFGRAASKSLIKAVLIVLIVSSLQGLSLSILGLCQKLAKNVVLSQGVAINASKLFAVHLSFAGQIAICALVMNALLMAVILLRQRHLSVQGA